ncbi:hypothetical protein DU508_08090 [Pedobacter chinensis]|uniref:Uncharacterized protein n=1 Tax=Pedobacter chinensis TaxID=2282421 RepID=A0A369PY15_9SPHI|nr:hypothetical protein [Pedobacter chinensis]RDC57140.1 hypothetical protein DU508_08090 [Pedobacter chinensis]
METQKFIVYRLNPNQQELDGEVSFDRNIDGRVFSECILEIQDHTAILKNENGEIKGVFSLHHFYLINV